MSPVADFTSEKRTSWPIALGLLLLVPIVGGSYSLSNLIRATQWVTHTDEVRLALSAMFATLVDAEGGTRGYVVAGEPTFLEAATRARNRWPDDLARVRLLTRDNPSQQRRLDELDRLAGAGFAALDRVRAAFAGGARGAQITPFMLEGKRSVDELTGILADMTHEEEQLDVQRKKEAARHWQWTVALFAASAAGLSFIVGLFWIQRRDGTNRRRRADELAQAHELFARVLEGVDVGITVLDTTGKVVFANGTAATILGQASPEALLSTAGKDVLSQFQLYRFDGTAFPLEELPSQAALQGKSSPEVQVRFRSRTSKEERWSVVRAVPTRDAAGKVVYAINFFREVTEKAREEAQRAFLLKAADELNAGLDYEKTLASLARLAVPILADWCAVDLAGGERPRRVAMAHVDPAKLALVEELERRYPTDPNAPGAVGDILRTGKPVIIPEIPAQMLKDAAKDATHLELIERLDLRSFIAVPLRGRHETLGVLTLATAESGRRYQPWDVTFAQSLADRAAMAIENARLVSDLERALTSETARRETAEDATRFAQSFIGMLGHDLRNPLNAITMAAKLMKRRATDDTNADRILSSATRMSNMVAQLLDLTRSRLAGGIPIEKRPGDLSRLVAGVIDELRTAFPGQRIDVRGMTSIPGLWDEDRLAQVVSNLVGNALEHGDAERGVVVTIESLGDRVRLGVHNEGTPIPEDMLPVMFDPYRRSDARSARSRGLGLGLFISEQIVRAHGGRIGVRSSETDGTTFEVTLPWTPVSAAEGLAIS